MAESALYEFTGDYSTHLDTAIQQAQLTVRNPNIDAANFPALDYGRKRLCGGLIEIPELADPEFPAIAFRERRMRAAELREVLSFMRNFPAVVENMKLAALGVLWRDAHDRRGAPVAYCGEHDRRLELLWLGGWWGKRYRALGIVDPSYTIGKKRRAR